MPQAAYLPIPVRVHRIQDLTPSMRRVTVRGDGLAGLAPLCLDRRIKLILPRTPGDTLSELHDSDDWYGTWCGLPDATRPALRTYTVRSARPDACEMDVDVVRHGTVGPAGRWIEQVRLGDSLVTVVPMADAENIDEIGLAWRPAGAKQVLIAGDETAAPAITNILESLDRDVTGHALIEVPHDDDRWPIDAPPGVTVTFLPRQGEPTGSLLEPAVVEAARSIEVHPETLAESCTDAATEAEGREDADAPPIWEEPTTTALADHYAWLAGESGVIKGLRRHLVGELGWTRQRVAFMGYWKHGRAEI